MQCSAQYIACLPFRQQCVRVQTHRTAGNPRARGSPVGRVARCDDVRGQGRVCVCSFQVVSCAHDDDNDDVMLADDDDVWARVIVLQWVSYLYVAKAGIRPASDNYMIYTRARCFFSPRRVHAGINNEHDIEAALQQTKKRRYKSEIAESRQRAFCAHGGECTVRETHRNMPLERIRRT